ncbi:MAG TPA: endonuclease III, partial [Spirochaetales bacterium]|nr:endonuclease III [Spirochaetales bacterium]
VGFFHTKARNLIATAQRICLENAGEPPSTIEDLIKLPGVGRKTANLVASACYGVPGVIVDTHVLRVSYRLGISAKKDPALIENLIRANFPQDKLTAFSHALNRHGKFVCTARKPGCTLEGCPLEELCPRIGITETQLDF